MALIENCSQGSPQAIAAFHKPADVKPKAEKNLD